MVTVMEPERYAFILKAMFKELDRKQVVQHELDS